MPTISSYVGYSHEEPWGQPRVVFGLAAEDAEQLAAVLSRHDREPAAYAAVTAQSATRDLSVAAEDRHGADRDGEDRYAALPVPQQAPSTTAEQRSGRNGGYDEPVYRQAAAAIQEARVADDSDQPAEPVTPPSAVPAAEPDSVAEPQTVPEGAAGPEGAAEPEGAAGPEAASGVGTQPGGGTGPQASPESSEGAIRGREATGRPSADDEMPGEGEKAANAPASADEPDFHTAGLMGSLARAASTARAHAEARIKATQTGDRDGKTGPPGLVGMPQIYATDVLEPLPVPDTPSRADDAPEESTSDADGVCARADSDDPGVPGPGPESDTDEPDRDDEPDRPVAPSEESAPVTARRSRAPRSHSVPRIARTKKPGAVKDA